MTPSSARQSFSRTFTLFSGLLMLAAMLPGGMARAQQAEQTRPTGPGVQVLHSHVRPVVSNGEVKPVGRLPVTQRMKLSITLPLRNQSELQAFLTRLSDPDSPDYRHYLSVAEFTEQFGPTEQDYQAVVNFAKANGLTVTQQHVNRLVVDIEGSAAQVEQAFHVNMNVYQHPTEDRTFFSPDREPSLNLSVPVWHITGLNNFSIPHPMVTKAAAGEPIPLTTGSGPGGTFLGGDMRAAYYLSTVAGGVTPLTGTLENVGILEFDGYTPSDVTASFDGVPYTVPLQNVLLDGASADTDTINGDVEQVLDIVQVMAMAPGLNQIIVYIGPLLTDTASNDTDIFNRMATDNIAKELSVSWGWYPEDATADDPIFLEFAAQGQTVFVASGDFGAFVDAYPDYFPAEDPYVVTVGGTDLTTSGPGGSWVAETAWRNSGGGPSPDGFPMQPWQQGLANGSNQASETVRNAPDVAAEANNDNYTCGISYDQFGTEHNGCSGGWGGTSFAAPRWAGFMALANQQSGANGNSTVGYLAPVLYPLALNPTSYANDFHDIVSGNNNDGWGVSWNAVTGYDMVTGLGSPKGQSLINALAGSLHATLAPSTMTFTTQIVGTSSATQSATYTNISGTTSALPTVVFGGINPSDFMLVTTGTSCPYAGGTVAASASCTIDVQFAPTAGGPREATVRAGNNYVSLSGTARLGAGVGTLAPTSFTFPNQAASTNAVMSARVTNTGTAEITFSSIAAGAGSAPNFSLVTTGTSCPYSGGSLPASAFCTIDVQFAAPAASTATLTGSVLLTDNIGVFNGVVGIAPSALTQTLSFSGNAVLGPGVATLAPTSLDFGNQFVNGTYTKSSLLTNVGTVPITLNSVTLSGTNMSDFPLITTGTSCPYSGGTVGVGTSCTIDVEFLVPSAASSLLSASVALNDNIGILNGSFSTLTQSVPISGQATSTYPIPSVSPSMQPLTAIPGSAGFTLTVSGTGLSLASVVQWNGSALTTTYISSTSISAAVPAADITVPGTASVTVKNPTPGGGVSNIAYFVITNPTAGVNYGNAPGSPFSPGGNGTPIVVAVADLNHDGKPDLVVGNDSPSGAGSVSFETLLNNGNGTFTAKATYVVVTNGNFAGITAIVPGDFNGDGIPDLAVVEGSTGAVQLWVGNGDGTFTLKSPTAAVSSPTSAVAGDFNADGHLDLAVGSFNGNTISILLGNGDGTFTAGTTVHAPGSYDVNGMTVGDFNNDGILDLATSCDDTCVVVFPGNNNGTFGAPIVTTTGPASTGFFGIVAGDFNHDGNLDLAATNTNNIVEILLGKGDGTFTAGATLAAGSFPTGLTLGDFNGDGILDLAATNSYNYQASTSPSTVSIYLGNGNGTFQPQVQVGAGDQPGSIATGDFYGNGRLGLAVANGADYGSVPTSVEVFVQPMITPTVTVTPAASSITTPQGLAVTVTVSGGSGNAVPTGSLILSGGSYTSAATALSAGSAIIDIPAGALSLGTDTLTANYTPDAYSSSFYNAATGSAAVLVGEAVGSSTTVSASFTIPAGTTVSSISVLTEGAPNLDFTQANGTTCTATTYSSATTCAVQVNFAPRFAGRRMGAIVLKDGSGSVLFTTYIRGIGFGPQIAFGPPAQSTLGSGFSNPRAGAVDGNGNVYVADLGNSAIKEMPAGCNSSSCVTTLGGGFSVTTAVALDGAGNVYVADYSNNAVKEMPPGCTAANYSSSLCTITTLGGGFSGPAGLVVDGDGNVYVSDSINNAVKMIPAGCTAAKYTGNLCTIATLGGGYSNPQAVAMDSSGNVYVANAANNVVNEIPPGCASSTCTIALGGGFFVPTGVAVDASGNVYVADAENSAVKVMPAGCASSTCVTTLGNGFSFPQGVMLDSAGNGYVADTQNNAVVELSLATPPSLSFAATNVGSQSSDSPQTVTLRNIGNMELTFSGENPIVSANFSGGSTCPAVLLAGSSCAMGFDFIPTTLGPITGTAVLTDNNLNASPAATQSIGLSGTGAAPTPLTPYIQVNGGGWRPISTVTVNPGDTVNLGEQVLSGGSYSWSGPSGFSNPATRLASATPLNSASNVFILTYTNTSGATSTVTFTINVSGTPLNPYIQVNGGGWRPISTVTVNPGDTVNLGEQVLSGGTYSWSGPSGFSNPATRVASAVPLTSATDVFILTYTNTVGATSTVTFTINVNGTPLTPYIQVNGGGWRPISTVTVNPGDTVNLGEQVLSGGSYSWSGPSGFVNPATRIASATPLNSASNVFTLTYTNTSGANSTVTFTINVNGTPLTPYIQVNGGGWRPISTVTVNPGDTVNLGEQVLSGGSYSWSGPTGFSNPATRIASAAPLNSATNVFTLTYTNTSGATSTVTFTINVNGTPLTPYIQVNSGGWQQRSTLTVNPGDTVNLGEQVLSGGSYSWSGPSGFVNPATRIASAAPLTSGANVFTLTYTNTSGVKSTQTFTIVLN